MKEPQQRSTRQLRVMAWPATRVERSGRESDPYPRLLYTGFSNRGIQVVNFHWTRLLSQRWHVWHMHWPDWIVAGSRPSWMVLPRLLWFWLLIKLARLKGTRVIWTAHNLKPHESRHPRLERWFFHMLTANLAAVICLSRSAKALVREKYRALRLVPAYVIRHGHYRGCYPDVISRRGARQELSLGEEDFVLLFIGQLRRYKNLIRLVECFRDGALEDWRLVIAGEPRDATLGTAIATQAASCRQIIPVLRFIPNEQLQIFLRASDLVVLPYVDILNSGAAILALSFGRPVLVPARGALVDLQQDVGPEWVMTYEQELTAQTLRLAVAWARKARPEEPRLDAFDWELIRDTTAAVYREVASAELRRLPC